MPLVKTVWNFNMDKNKQKRNTRGRSSFNRPKPEFEQKIVSIRRVTRVMAGGRRFSFSVALVAGDRKGAVGFGLGKSNDTATAIGKAFREAKKNMVKLNLTKDSSIPHDLHAKFSGSEVVMMPNKGRGLVAGTVVRDILKLAGVKDVTAKVIGGTKNKLNNSKAVIKALSEISSKYVKKAPEKTEGKEGNKEKVEKVQGDKKVEEKAPETKKEEVATK